MARAADSRCVIYAYGHRQPDRYARSYVPVFPSIYPARSWLHRFIAGKPFEQQGNRLLMASDFDIELRCDEFDQLLKPPVEDEDLGEHAKLILRFKYGTWDEVHAVPQLEDEAQPLLSNRAPKPERQHRPAVPPEFVTISDLCAGSNILPTHARAALRASGRVKPEHGWGFSPSELPTIRKLIGLG
jgi:hypothetical protein